MVRYRYILPRSPLELFQLAQLNGLLHNPLSNDLHSFLPTVPGSQHSILCFSGDRQAAPDSIFPMLAERGCSLASGCHTLPPCLLCSQVDYNSLLQAASLHSNMSQPASQCSCCSFEVEIGHPGVAKIRKRGIWAPYLHTQAFTESLPEDSLVSALPLNDTGLQLLYKRHPPSRFLGLVWEGSLLSSAPPVLQHRPGKDSLWCACKPACDTFLR